MVLVNSLFHPVVAIILMAAVLAAIMSTADSQLLVSSSALAEDFYKAILKKNADGNELIWIGRAAVVVIALLALYFALNPESTVLGLVSYTWAGFGAAFGPAILLSLFLETHQSSWCTGWHSAGRDYRGGLETTSGGLFDLYEIIPGFLLATLAIMVVSLLTAEPDAELQATFDEVDRQMARWS